MKTVSPLEIEGSRLVFEPPDPRKLGIASRNMFIIGRKSDVFYVQQILKRMEANPSEIALTSSGVNIKALLKVLLIVTSMRRYYIHKIYLWLEKMAPKHRSKWKDVFVVRMLVVLRKMAKLKNTINITSHHKSK